MKNLLILLLKNIYENMKENIKDMKEENSMTESSSLKLTTL